MKRDPHSSRPFITTDYRGRAELLNLESYFRTTAHHYVLLYFIYVHFIICYKLLNSRFFYCTACSFSSVKYRTISIKSRFYQLGCINFTASFIVSVRLLCSEIVWSDWNWKNSQLGHGICKQRFVYIWDVFMTLMMMMIVPVIVVVVAIAVASCIR